MPTKVGSHVDIIRLATDGAEWLQRKDQCAAQEARSAPQVPVVSQKYERIRKLESWRRSRNSRRPADAVPWCTSPIEADSSLGPDSHHPIISLSGIPSAVMVFRILHPILASTLYAANPLARIAEPTIAL